jgi:hypothetical protein
VGSNIGSETAYPDWGFRGFLHSLCRKYKYITSLPIHYSPISPLFCVRNTVTWLLKAWIVEPEETFIARQRLGKHVPATMNAEATIEVLLGGCFRSMQSCYWRRDLRFGSAVCSWAL